MRAVIPLLIAIALSREARALDVLFPAYANPCCGGGPVMWTQLAASAAAPGRAYGLHVIFNPASGPGTAVDPNYVGANGQGPLPALRSAGAIVYGYVTTSYGARSTSAVIADIDAYLVGHYAGLIDGIFFDEVSSDLAEVGRHRAYSDHVRTRRPGARTIGNPGITAIQNPSGQTTWSATDYAHAFDVLVSFEHTGAEYRSGYAPPIYLAARPASAFAHLIHSDGPFDPALVPLAASRKAGLLFVSDDGMPNPYDSMPTDWSAFVDAVNASSAASVPSASLAARIGGLVALLAAGSRAAGRSFPSRGEASPISRRNGLRRRP